MSSDRDDNSDNGVQTNGAAANGAFSPDDPRVTPLGGNAGVHIQSDEQQRDDSQPTEQSSLSVDFGGFIVSLGTSCMVNLGKQINPETGEYSRDLAAARQTIDILEMLRRKTRGNLEENERQLLTTLLKDLRKAYRDVKD